MLFKFSKKRKYEMAFGKNLDNSVSQQAQSRVIQIVKLTIDQVVEQVKNSEPSSIVSLSGKNIIRG